MQKYQNTGRKSGVEEFEIGQDYILIKYFKTPKLYKYSYASAGKEKVEKMKELAIKGQGLNGYVNRVAEFEYEGGKG